CSGSTAFATPWNSDALFDYTSAEMGIDQALFHFDYGSAKQRIGQFRFTHPAVEASRFEYPFHLLTIPLSVMVSTISASVRVKHQRIESRLSCIFFLANHEET